ncbi:hypothetical protein BD408DRAFT_447933 [Parasitella parasitica]|nr:hypothetical protein BD408DRAFT_447933 [Parasitella parasitica]
MKNKFAIPTSINSPLPTSLAGECKKATNILDAFGTWSAPSAIVTGGMGAGGQIGAKLTDFALVLNTKEAVKTFSHFGNITLGGNLGECRSIWIGYLEAYFSKTCGLFAGVSLESSVIFTRNDASEKIYGERVFAKQLLNGSVAPPYEADSLYRALDAKSRTLGNTGTIYQRTIQQEESKGNVYRCTSISAPGTLRIPGVRQQVGGYGAPTNTTVHRLHHSSQQAYAYFLKYQLQASCAATTVRRPATQLYEQDGDLNFQADDVITVTEKTDSQDDWWTDRLNGQIGSFPANYAEIL